METALRYELVQAIPELNNQIFPTNAPEGAKGTYLVYARLTTDETKTLEGYTGSGAITYMFSIMAKKYSDVVDMRNKVKELLLSLPKTWIGKDISIFVEDLSINNITEQYEYELGVNRGIIDFTIYY